MSGGSVLIKGRTETNRSVEAVELTDTKELKTVICDEDGEILGDSNSMKVILTDELGNTLGGTDAVKVVLCGTQSDATVTPLLCDADGKLITSTGA